MTANLWENLKKISKNKGLSIKNIEESAKLPKNSLYNWKKHNPSSDNLQKVADVLGVTVNDLLGKKDHKKKTADLNDEDIIFTYEGRQIPPEDIELMKRLLRGKKE